jgi:hypothetical protein
MGRFFNTLVVDEHDSGHYHRLCFGARLGEPALDQQFIYPLTLHRIT